MRNQEIDFLRGLAVILVLCRHHLFWEPLKTIGWIGVDLFFVLSGFLVSGLLFDEFKKSGHINIFRFYIRRGFKIYPSFYIFLLTTYLLQGHFNLGTYSQKQFISEIFFIQNYFYPIWNHTWSLAIEEHFYLLLPALLWVLIKTKKISNTFFVVAVLGSTIVSVILFRFLTNTFLSNLSQTHSFATHLRIDGLLFGALLSYLHHFDYHYISRINNKYFNSRFSFIAIIAVILFLPLFFNFKSYIMNTIGYSVLYIAFGSVLIILLNNKEVPGRIKKIISNKVYKYFAMVGVYSYSIYLWHMIIDKLVVYYLPWPEVNSRISFIPFFFMSIILGILTSIIIEQNFLKIRDRLFPKI